MQNGPYGRSCEIQNDGQEMAVMVAKILIVTIQVNLCIKLFLLKIFAIKLSSQPFLGYHFGFCNFSHGPFYIRPHLFYNQAVFKNISLLFSFDVCFDIDDSGKTSKCGRTVMRIQLNRTPNIWNVAEFSIELCTGVFYSSVLIYSVT